MSMDRQNITLSLPKSTLRQAKHMAIDHGTSLSALLAEYVEQVVRQDEHYREAMRRARQRLARGFDLGTRGRIRTSRAELHER